MEMLTITNLKKRFGDKEVLKGVSLKVSKNNDYEDDFGTVGSG